MSLLKTIRTQLGMSATATHNFTLDASASNGTMKLARGNAGATTQDILTVDASGNVNALVGIQKNGSILQALSDFTGSNVSLASSGYQKLPSGLIVQWGTSGGGSVTFPISFPTAMRSFSAITSSTAGDGNSRDVWVLSGSQTLSGLTVSRQSNVDGFYWIALGN